MDLEILANSLEESSIISEVWPYVAGAFGGMVFYGIGRFFYKCKERWNQEDSKKEKPVDERTSERGVVSPS